MSNKKGNNMSLINFVDGRKFLLSTTEARGMARGLPSKLQMAIYDRVLDPWNITPTFDPPQVCNIHSWQDGSDNTATQCIHNFFGEEKRNFHRQK